MRAIRRAVVYSLTGFVTEVAFSAVHDAVRGREVRFRTSPWMFSIYALVLPLYEPLHDSIRAAPRPLRAAVYGSGFLGVEYATGWAIRVATGEAPWDYTYAKRHVNGLIRPEYFLFWAAAGLALEPLHDRLRNEPA